jgi:hypothetical protein
VLWTWKPEQLLVQDQTLAFDLVGLIGQLSSVAGESTIFIFIGFPSDQPGLVNGTLGFLDCRLSNLELSSLSNMTSHES